MSLKYYPAREIIFPIEYIIANLAGLPVRILRNEPNDNIWIKYPKLTTLLPNPKQIPKPMSLSVYPRLGKQD